MSKTLAIAALMLTAAVGLALAQPVIVAAPADSATTVAIPVATWAASLRDTVIAIAVGVLTVVSAALPGHVVLLMKMFRVEQLIQRAVDYAINAVIGASKDGVITIDVGNRVIAVAMQYVVDHGPAKLIEWMGGMDKIREKIVARIPVVSPDIGLK